MLNDNTGKGSIYEAEMGGGGGVRAKVGINE